MQALLQPSVDVKNLRCFRVSGQNEFHIGRPAGAGRLSWEIIDLASFFPKKYSTKTTPYQAVWGSKNDTPQNMEPLLKTF